MPFTPRMPFMPHMRTATRRRTGQALGALLVADGLAHLYWATGATWPAADERALSSAVLGTQVSFAPPVVLPLAAVALAGAAAVLGHAYGRGGRVTRAVTAAVAAGLAVRGLAGLGWAAGLIDSPPGPFYVLNLALYTPVCLGFGWAAARLARAR
ncbi:DUF3995 domain-containing protein [Streptomyces sp. APSN-46.1]|uniref:DUF3995 domain-containing protein n=1 Tax=Streptomyces sp. APSN-46.1 TaxID=2929049 RepID=UPI001FB3CA56|nr:DUF3995 domain-containing protein [Streptomyces sp. APSN-46.1]MCJ1679218.1 DUF3995 domain-containing protein [Streptomyces sp. APSN-46.1]